MVKGVIFDMDGTLVDSMKDWRYVNEDYLKQQGYTVPENFQEIVTPMSSQQFANYCIETYGVKDSEETIIKWIRQNMRERYRHSIPLKPYAQELIDDLLKRGVRLCIATATATELYPIALETHQLTDKFEFIINCDEVGANKKSPRIFHIAAERLGLTPKDIVVYEDSFYGIKSASEGGYNVVGVYDEVACATMSPDILASYSNCYIRSFKEYMESDDYKNLFLD